MIKSYHSKYEVILYLICVGIFYSTTLIYGSILLQILSTILFFYYSFYVIKQDWKRIVVKPNYLIVIDYVGTEKRYPAEDLILYKPRWRTSNPPFTNSSIKIIEKIDKRGIGIIYFLSKSRRAEFVNLIINNGYVYSENIEKY